MSETTPLVSVLMLTYNHAPYIGQAIESVLNQQTRYPFELIICDDASTDDTREVVRRYAADPRIVCSFQPRNTKFGKNFVDGVMKIRGRYVAFCEGDDYWTHPQKLEMQVHFLEMHPDFSVCAHKVQILSEQDRQPGAQKHCVYKDCNSDDERIKNGIFYADEAIANYYFQTGSLVLRWRFREGFPHWFRKRMMFDHFMFMLHAVEGKIKYFDTPMSVWRRHGGGYTWLQTQDKGLFFQKEGYDWIQMYTHMDKFFSFRFHWQIRERILLALRSIAANCMETGNVSQLRLLVSRHKSYFEDILKDAVLVDALRLACPEKPEFMPPWSTGVEAGDEDAEKDAGTDAPRQKNIEVSLPEAGKLALEDIPVCEGSVWDAWTAGQEYARFFNLRSALMRLLWERGVSSVWLPTYMPPILLDNLRSCQFTNNCYGVNAQLEPSEEFLKEVRPGDAVVTISYLGRPVPASLKEALAARDDILLIEDRAHCLDAAPMSGADAVIYSPRHVMGVPDGGLLVGRGTAALEQWCLPQLSSHQRRRHDLLLQEFESPTDSPVRAQLLRAGDGMKHQLSRRPMSRLTEALLRRIPLREAAERRRRNWRILYEMLGRLCLWPLPHPDFAPYAFPLVTPRNLPTEILHTSLSRRGIACHRMWHPLDLTKNFYPIEESLAARLLLLPCGHNLAQADVERVGEETLRVLTESGCAGEGGGFGVL